MKRYKKSNVVYLKNSNEWNECECSYVLLWKSMVFIDFINIYTKYYLWWNVVSVFLVLRQKDKKEKLKLTAAPWSCTF
jgi:hypothetical protein